MKQISRSFQNIRTLLISVVVAANLFVFALVGYSLYESYRNQELRAAVQTQNLSTILEQNLSEKMRVVEQALLVAREEFNRQQAAGHIQQRELSRYLENLQKRLPELDGLRITDTSGQIRYGKDIGPEGGAMLADRDYFQIQREQSRFGHYLGAPVQSRVSGQWIVAMSHRLEKPDGGFAGIVYATINLEGLTQLFSQLELGRMGSLILRDEQLRLIARYPAVDGPSGKVGSAKTSIEFAELVATGQRAATYETQRGSDDVHRIYSYRRLPDWPWYVVAGLAREEYLRSWYHQAARYTGFALLFLVVSLLAAYWIWRGWRRQLAIADELKESLRQREEAQEALRRSKEEAEAANKAKSQFLAVMSHELRTPMNGILGMTQMLMMPGVEEKDRIDYARTVYNSGQTLQTLLNDILDHSKIEAGRMELARVAYAPSQLVQEVATLFRESARAKGLALNVVDELPTGERHWGDPHRLRQILSNLTNNAIKFTDHGSVILKLGRRMSMAPTRGECLWFAVTDTGIGIAEEKQQALFQTFSQVDDSFTRRYGGTGLGLAISRNLVQLMGGEVGVVSQAGAGATFWFEVPVGPVAQHEESRQRDRMASAETSACSVPPPSGTLDTDALLRCFGGDREMAQCAVGVFIEDVLGLMSKLEAALAADNMADARLFAHSIQGSAGSVAAERLAVLAGILDQALTEGEASGATILLSDMRQVVAETVHALQAFVEQSSTPSAEEA